METKSSKKPFNNVEFVNLKNKNKFCEKCDCYHPALCSCKKEVVCDPLTDEAKEQLVLDVMEQYGELIRMTEIEMVSRRNDLLDVICDMADKGKIVLVDKEFYLYGLPGKTYKKPHYCSG